MRNTNPHKKFLFFSPVERFFFLIIEVSWKPSPSDDSYNHKSNCNLYNKYVMDTKIINDPYIQMIINKPQNSTNDNYEMNLLQCNDDISNQRSQ